MKLENLGWNQAFSHSFAQNSTHGRFPARVTFASRDRWRLIGADGEYSAVLSGKSRNVHDMEFPVVGDWVTASATGDSGAVIHGVLPRRTILARGSSGGRKTRDGASQAKQVLAANVTCAFIVCGLDRDYSPRRVERYLAMCYGGGVVPVVLLNKADIGEDAEGRALEISRVAPGVEVLTICAHHPADIQRVAVFLHPGHTFCLLGSSGAGKSTLLNGLFGTEMQSTGEVSLATNKGRHTTAHRELFTLPGGALVIDTPGLREVALPGEEGLGRAFSEIEEISLACRFRDCSHAGEPGCAVMAAVERGEIPRERWESYERLKREAAHRRAASERGALGVEKMRWKTISKDIRRYFRSKD